MLSFRDAEQAVHLSRFFKTGPGQYGEGDRFLGIKVPVTRCVVQKMWSVCSPEQLDECLKSPWHEVRLAALLTLVQQFRHARGDQERQRCIVDFYLAHLEAVNNWDLVDLSCYELLGTWLLDKDASLLYDLARDGRTIWEQRIGMVSTMQFIRHDRLEDTYAIADLLLYHRHDLIHKAVGWLLRETGKRDGSRLRSYLTTVAPLPSAQQHSDSGRTDQRTTVMPRYRMMPRTMLRYTIEKFPPEERMRYLKGEENRACSRTALTKIVYLQQKQ